MRTGLAARWPSSWRQDRRTNCRMPWLCSNSVPRVPKWVVADRGYSSHAFRQHIRDLGSRPAIPTKRNEAPVACPQCYNNRNQVERLWSRLKEGRAIATRYEKTANPFMEVLCLAAAIDWIKR